MQAEVTQPICAGEIARCLRDENLAAVTGGGDARSAMHIEPDVSLLGDQRLPGVQSDAHSDRSAGERLACRRRRRQRIGGPRKRDEERVALCIDLDAAEAMELLAQGATVIDQNLGVSIAELLEQPCRARDIREQERDGSLR